VLLLLLLVVTLLLLLVLLLLWRRWWLLHGRRHEWRRLPQRCRSCSGSLCSAGGQPRLRAKELSLAVGHLDWLTLPLLLLLVLARWWRLLQLAKQHHVERGVQVACKVIITSASCCCCRCCCCCSYQASAVRAGGQTWARQTWAHQPWAARHATKGCVDGCRSCLPCRRITCSSSSSGGGRCCCS
jgi:hypothetical protein